MLSDSENDSIIGEALVRNNDINTKVELIVVIRLRLIELNN